MKARRTSFVPSQNEYPSNNSSMHVPTMPSLHQPETEKHYTGVNAYGKKYIADHQRNRSKIRRVSTRQLIYIISIVSILAIYMLVLYLETPNSPNNTINNINIDLNNYIESNHGRLDAIVTIAMCGFTATAMVQALRNAGGWERPIFVITDNPHQEDVTISTPVDIRGNHPQYLSPDDFEEYSRGAEQFNPEIWSKWHKTQVFHLLPSNIETVLFLDADMLAQQPLGYVWQQEVSPLIADPSCHLILYPERWYTKIPLLGQKSRNLTGRYNSGMWIAKRSESSRILQEWSDRMVHPPWMGRDQSKLTEAIDATAAAAAATQDTFLTSTVAKSAIGIGSDGHSETYGKVHSLTVLSQDGQMQLRGFRESGRYVKKNANADQVCSLPSRWKHVQNQADLFDRLWFGWLYGDGTFLHMSSHKEGDWKLMLSQKCDLSQLSKQKQPTDW